jgi:hypothetical protein
MRWVRTVKTASGTTAVQIACSSSQGLGGASGAFGAYGTVVPVPLEDLPDWLPAWCVDHLGGEPAGVLFQRHQVSMVFGLRLAGGTDVVVKALHGDTPLSGDALRAQRAERLHRARAWHQHAHPASTYPRRNVWPHQLFETPANCALI